jgi:superfamily I DNA/RNA helicase
MNIEQKIVDMDYKDIMNSLTLNEQQLNIINSTEQNTLVIAAPGSGKTHTLISMYIKLIVEDNYDPNQIILITFTKKAGQEMMGRLSSLIPTKLPKYIGSLHGFCFKILQDIKNINYTILDEKESRDLIKNTIDNINNIDDNIISIIKSKISIIID